ncbi:MAG: aspartate aminotransferase family protein [Chloroflexi bacterium]|nr:aspartate aminotransferase family protein [Chloroflexota bacterium]
MSERWGQRDAALIADSEKIRYYPLVARAANGCTITDVDGKHYLDLTAGWCVANTGYGHPAITRAVDTAYRELSFACAASVAHPQAIELAERLAAGAPGSGPKKVWFGNSGSDANDGVAKLVPLARKRPRMISFFGGMHGMVAGSSGLSALPITTRFLGGGNVTRVPYPNPYRPTFSADPEREAAECLRFIEEQVLVNVSPPEQTAAIIVEPLQSDAGVIVPPDSFLPGLEQLCRAYDLLLIDDEVKVGCGRTGRMWACELTGTVPDVLVAGKALGSGLPISAVIGPASVLDVVPGGHVFTLAGNPVCCAAALATLHVIEREDLAANATAMGSRIMAHLRQMQGRHQWIGDVRGKGLIVGVELVRDRDTKEPAVLETAKLCYRAFELGMVLQCPVGIRANVIEITPPLTITSAEVDRGMEILDQALADVERGLVPDERIRTTGW